MKFAEAPILASAAKPFVLNPAAAPFVPAKWANKKAAPAAFSPAEPVRHLSSSTLLLPLLHCRLSW